MSATTVVPHADTGFNRRATARTAARTAALTAALAIAVVSAASCASMRYSSAFNPSVTVQVEHPPYAGLLVEEVAFAGDSRAGGGRAGAAEARCEAEWEQALTQEFLERGVRVARGDGGQNADAVIAVDVTRCETEQERFESTREIVERVGENTRRRTVPEYHARTVVRFRGTFEVVDPSAGLVAASRTLAHEPEMMNSSIRGQPDFPSPGTVAGRAYRSTIRTIAPILFSWFEARELVFFDVDRCGMDRAYRAVEARDYQRALEMSIASASACEPGSGEDIDHRDLAAAHYNVGVLHRMLGDFDSALESFEQAREADPRNRIVRDAVRETLSAQEIAASLRSLVEGRGNQGPTAAGRAAAGTAGAS